MHQLVLWDISQAQWFTLIGHVQGRYCARVSLIVVLTKHWLWSYSVHELDDLNPDFAAILLLQRKH